MVMYWPVSDPVSVSDAWDPGVITSAAATVARSPSGTCYEEDNGWGWIIATLVTWWWWEKWPPTFLQVDCHFIFNWQKRVRYADNNLELDSSFCHFVGCYCYVLAIYLKYLDITKQDYSLFRHCGMSCHSSHNTDHYVTIVTRRHSHHKILLWAF